MVRLPLAKPDALCEILTADLPPEALDQPAGADEIAQVIERVLGANAGISGEGLGLPGRSSVRDAYFAVIQSDEFRAACGRISASYAW
jgi:hypothetical protein